MGGNTEEQITNKQTKQANKQRERELTNHRPKNQKKMKKNFSTCCFK